MSFIQNAINNKLPTSALTGTISTAQVAASAITYAKIQNESASTLLGNPTGSGAAPSEITLGSGLSFSGTTLTASGGTTINTLQIDQTPSGSTYGVLAGTVNGANAVFTVSNSAYVSGSLMVFLNGQEQTQGASYDWTETSPSSGTFTFNVAPPTGSIIQAVYIKTATTSGTGNAPVVLATVAGINAQTVANTTLYTVPAGKTAVITGYTVRCTAATAITNGASAGIGNIAGTNNIVSSQAMNALTSVLGTFQWSVTGISLATAAAGVIYFNLGTGATGTSQTLTVDLLGYTE